MNIINKLEELKLNIDEILYQLNPKTINNQKIIFCFPSRGRPQLFKKQLDNFYSKLSNKYNYEVLITIDTDDTTMNNGSILKYLSKKPYLKYQLGKSNSKIHAVNRTMDIAPEDWNIIVLLSDDMTIIQQNFDEIIINDMKKHYPDYSGGLWYPDGRQKNLCTFSILGRLQYNYYGNIYNSQFKSQWCDNYYHQTAMKLGKLIYIDKKIITHDWCKDHRGQPLRDELFKKNAKEVPQDKLTYQKLIKEFDEKLQSK